MTIAIVDEAAFVLMIPGARDVLVPVSHLDYESPILVLSAQTSLDSLEPRLLLNSAIWLFLVTAAGLVGFALWTKVGRGTSRFVVLALIAVFICGLNFVTEMIEFFWPATKLTRYLELLTAGVAWLTLVYVCWAIATRLRGLTNNTSMIESDRLDAFLHAIAEIPTNLDSLGKPSQNQIEQLGRDAPAAHELRDQRQPNTENTFLHPDDLAKIRQAWAIGYKSGEAFSVKFRIKEQSGEYQWYQSRYTPIQAENDEGVQHPRTELGVNSDSGTERKAEEELHARRLIYTSILSQSSESIALIDVASERLIEFNDAACRSLGYTREELASLTVNQIDAEVLAHDLDRIFRDLSQSSIEAGHSVSHVIEHRYLHRCGIDRDFQIRVQALLIHERPTLCMIWNDITEKKRAENAIHRNEDRWRFAGEVTGDGVWEWDIASKNTYFSPRWKELAGYGDDEIKGGIEEWMNRICPDDYARASTELFSYLEGQRSSFLNEHRILNKNGEWQWRLARGMVIDRDSNGKPLRMIGTHADISSIKSAESLERTRAETMTLVASGAALEIILNSIVRGIESSNPGMLCTILLLDETGTRLLCTSAPSLPDFYNAAVHGMEIGPLEGSCGSAAYLCERVIVEDVNSDFRWVNFKDVAARANLVSCWSEPIKNASEKVIGTFAIYHRQPHKPTTADLLLISECAQLASIAIEGKTVADERTRLAEVLKVGVNEIFIIDAETMKFVYVNETALKNLGYTWETLRTLQMPDVAPDLTPEIFHRLVGEMLRGEVEIVDREVRRKRADGTVYEVEAVWQFVKQPNKKFILIVDKDISDRREAERAKEALLIFAKSTLDGMTANICVLDEQGNLLMVNEAWRKFAEANGGLNPQVDAGANYLQACANAYGPSSEYAQKFVQAFRKIISGEEQRIIFEYTYDTPDKLFWFEARCAVLKGDDRARVVVAHEDITERKVAEQELTASREHLRAIVEAAPECIKMLDRSGHLIDMNAAGLNMIESPSLEAVRGHVVYGLVVPEQRDSYIAFNEQICSGKSGQLEFEIIGLGGKRLTLLSLAVPLKQADGTFLNLSLSRDVTNTNRDRERLSRYTQRLEYLHEVDRAIRSVRSPQELAATALEHVERLTPAWFSGVGLTDLSTGEIRPLAHRGILANMHVVGEPVDQNFSTIDGNEEVRQEQLFVLDDVKDVELRSPVFLALRAAGMRSLVMLPILKFGNTNAGMILGANQPHAFTPEHIEIAQEVCTSLAIALNQSFLFEEIKTAKGRLEGLSRRLIEAEESERRRIARELHDETGQGLMAIKINLHSLLREAAIPAVKDRLNESLSLIERTIAQVRGLSHELRPSLLDDFGLESALQSLTKSFSQRTGFKVRLICESNLHRFGSDIETACYRICQEAMNNTLKHADASEIQISLHREEKLLHLEIIDDGVGFEISEKNRHAEDQGIGIAGMRERASLVGGTCTVNSAKGSGTCIIVHIPIDDASTESLNTIRIKG